MGGGRKDDSAVVQWGIVLIARWFGAQASDASSSARLQRVGGVGRLTMGSGSLALGR